MKAEWLQKRLIRISAEAYKMLTAHSTGELKEDLQQEDGTFLIEVDEDVWRGLQSIDPDPDKAVRALCLMAPAERRALKWKQ